MLLRPSLLPALAVFAVAARHQNFAQAAQELHLTASAVSHHVRRLEEVLETRLFLRHARGVRLTAEGRQLADAASAAFADVAAVAHHLQPDADSVPLRITTLRSLSYCWLLPRLPRFTQAHPHIRIELHTGSGLDRYDDNGPEVGIRYGLGQWPGLHAQHLMDDNLFPVASPALAGVETLQDPTRIAELPLLSDLSPQGWRDWFRHAGVRPPSPMPPMHTFADSTDAMRAAVYGMGAVLARTHVAQPYLQRYELLRLPGPALKARYAYYVVHAEGQAPSPAARLFIDWLLEQAQDERTPIPALPDSLLGAHAYSRLTVPSPGLCPRPARLQATPHRTYAMALLRLRITGTEDDARAISDLLLGLDGIEHVEETDDLMPHMDDDDSSSAGLSDDIGPGTHELEVEVGNESTAQKVRDAVQELALELDVFVEYETDEG